MAGSIEEPRVCPELTPFITLIRERMRDQFPN